MGDYVVKGHKIWNWTYDLEKAELYHWSSDNVADVYGPSSAVGLTTRANTWGRRRSNQLLQ
jgi:hypothetical protein